MQCKLIRTDNSKIAFPEYNQNIFLPITNNYFQLVWNKVVELNTEPNEAKAFFTELVEQIKTMGFIPPLLFAAVKDVNGEYQKIVVSNNLSKDEEQLIVNVFLPSVIRTNELVANVQDKVPVSSDLPIRVIVSDLYNVVFTITNNKQKSLEFVSKVTKVMNKSFQSPIPALKKPLSVMAMLRNSAALELPKLNVAGIKKLFQVEQNLLS